MEEAPTTTTTNHQPFHLYLHLHAIPLSCFLLIIEKTNLQTRSACVCRGLNERELESEGTNTDHHLSRRVWVVVVLVLVGWRAEEEEEEEEEEERIPSCILTTCTSY